MRRSWADLFTTPALLIASHASANDKIKARYAFHDINGKITHRFSARSKLSLAMYFGRDLFKSRVRQVFDEGTQIREERYGTDFNMQWGNLTATLAWNYQFTPKLAGDFRWYMPVTCPYMIIQKMTGIMRLIKKYPWSITCKATVRLSMMCVIVLLLIIVLLPDIIYVSEAITCIICIVLNAWFRRISGERMESSIPFLQQV